MPSQNLLSHYLLGTLFILSASTFAQDFKLPSRALAETRAPWELKINSNVLQVLSKLKNAARLGAAYDTFATSWVQVDARGRLRLALRVQNIHADLLARLQAYSFEIETTTQNLKISSRHHLVTGYAPFEQIEKLATLPEVFHIRPVDRPLAQAGEVLTAADTILSVAAARATFHVNGTGQKVGVLSDGVAHLSTAQASLDLPANVQVLNNRGSGDEGTALLEIVHDLAPGADLAFADNGLSEADFANNILLLRNAGAKTICDDVLYLLEPAFEDGLIAQTVAQVTTNDDVVYISAAGNHELDHYEAEFVSNDGDAVHEFSAAPFDESMNVTIGAGSTMLLVLQWNNAFAQASDNYDLYVYDTGTNILARGTDIQNGDDDPLEFVEYRNNFFLPRTVQIVVTKVSGANRRIKLYTFGNGITPTQYAGTMPGTIYGHAAAAQALTVGAIDANDFARDNIQPFSARGPARIYSFDTAGNPIAFAERAKPDVIALDGVQTKVGQAGFFANPFFGTSAAAPHVAGIAALMRALTPNKSAHEIAAALRNTAYDLGTSGIDFIYGHGRVDALAASEAIACASDGDMNRDAALTPGDALCVFNLYLTGAADACAKHALACAKLIADVNCDGVITPGDALAIFQRYLQGQAPTACFARNTLSSTR